MFNAFELHNGRLRQIPVDSRDDLAKTNPIWVDLVDPTEEERVWAQERYEVDIPDPADLTDLEASARFYVEDNGEIHLHSDFLLDKEDESRNVAVAFILHKNILFSVRAEELPVFRLQRLRARNQPGYVSEGKDVLLDLYAADAEYSADALEDVYAALEAVGRQVLSNQMTDTEAGKVLAAIAKEEDLNGRIRRNVLDTRRAVSFMMRGKLLDADQADDKFQRARDAQADAAAARNAHAAQALCDLVRAVVEFAVIQRRILEAQGDAFCMDRGVLFEGAMQCGIGGELFPTAAPATDSLQFGGGQHRQMAYRCARRRH